jgi:ATP-dependent Clp protease ATP-binding subunit ClpA
MLEGLDTHGCTSDLIAIVERAITLSPLAVLLRQSLFIESVCCVILGWEEKVAQHILHEIGVDFGYLSRALDKRIRQHAFNPRKRRMSVDDLLSNGVTRGNALIARARKEAASMKKDYVGTEHLLMAIVGMSRGDFAKLLVRHGITSPIVRETAIRVLSPD